MKKIISDYVCGLLYGDGASYICDNGDREEYLFSTTHFQLAEIVKEEFDRLGIHYYSTQRHHVSEDKKNYETLEIVGTRNAESIAILRSNDVIYDDDHTSIKTNKDFLRGYLETKGTMFEYTDKNSTSWRIAFSGSKSDMTILKKFLQDELSVKSSSIIRRNERESLGVMSESYRLPIQNRDGVNKIVEYISGGLTSRYLENKIEEFKRFNKKTPFNRKRSVYKHYKSASQYMARELGMTLNGIKNDIRPNNWTLIYLWNKEGVNTVIFNGYESSYKYLCDIYRKETGYNPPLVYNED